MSEPVRILIVDDNAEDRTACKRILIRDGTTDYIFFEADTAKQALLSIHDNAPDCILIDNQLPDLDDFNRFMLFPDGCRGKTPGVVMLTNEDSGHPADRHFDDGAKDFPVQSEFSSEGLRRAIETAIEIAGRRRLLTLKEGALKRMAITDELTGLYSRQYIMDQLEAEIYRAQRYDLPFCVAMIDLDHFGELNDRYGPVAGDRILKEIGDFIKKNTRCLDIVSRYADATFMIILPNTGLEQARILSERLHSKIRTLNFDLTAENAFHPSCSIGLSEYDIGVKTKDVLVQRAQQALYEAKSRDRLSTWSENCSMASAHEVS